MVVAGFFCKPLDYLHSIQTFRRLLNSHGITREEEKKYLALGKINVKTIPQEAQPCVEGDYFVEDQRLVC